jgi:hypothetical protein
MSAAHTPGPWTHHKFGVKTVIWGARRSYVCEFGGDGISAEDARLIAGAPDLAKAAQNTVAYYAATQPGRTCLIDELNPCGGLNHWGMGDGCPLCSARAALTKVGAL